MRTSTAIALMGLTTLVGISAISGMAHKVNRASEPYTAIDGDTLRHGSERIRLLYIDAPEMPGHCRPHRVCVPGDPYAARRALARAITRGTVQCVGSEIDVYGRRLAECFVTDQHGNTVSINDWLLSNRLVQRYRSRRHVASLEQSRKARKAA